MPSEFLMWLPKLTGLVFFFAFGACVGSLVNVLVYRLPLGLDVVRPSSRCPSCQTKLTWRENIPILGWILLRGKCRFCKCRVSPEYPIVETIVALLFAGVYLFWFVLPEMTTGGVGLFGVDWRVVRPEWAMMGLSRTWPAVVTILILLSCLVAATIIDARTFMIPLSLTWTPALVALVLHVGHAAWFDIQPPHWTRFARGWTWTIATPGIYDWRWVGIGLGGIVGLGISLLLLRLGLIRQSFADYDEWEAEHLKQVEAEKKATTQGEAGTDEPPAPEGSADAESPAEETQGEGDAAVWIQYPHARREMLKEVAFVSMPVTLGFVGGWLAPRLVEWTAGSPVVEPLTGRLISAVEVPGWLMVLAGVLLGYLIGGGVVWAVRIFGSLAFGKEAMGLGDVHLMAGVGACLGWIDPVIAFFGAAFLAIGWEIARRLVWRKGDGMLPYGPHLAAATVLVIFFKPVIEIGLGVLFGRETPLPLP